MSRGRKQSHIIDWKEEARMNIKIKQFLNGGHSWAIVGHHLSRALRARGHGIDLFSTDGIDTFPADLKENLYGWVDEKKLVHSVREPLRQYDMQISYTAPHNFPNYLSNGLHNRFGIWCYEYPLIPVGFAKYHAAVDAILAPSKFARDGFIRGGVPSSKVVTIPHGVVEEKSRDSYPVKSKKSFKILLLIGQPHLRKGLEEAFEAYFKSFTNKDDVVMLARISMPKGKPMGHNVDPIKILNRLKTKYPQHPEVEMIGYLNEVGDILNVSQVCFSMTKAEGFWMPGLEAMRYGVIPMAPRYGGLLDFCNDKNSILIEGKEVKADLAAQYWTPDIRNSWFKPDVDDAAEKLRSLYLNYEVHYAKMIDAMTATADSMSWNKVAQQIEGLCR